MSSVKRGILTSFAIKHLIEELLTLLFIQQHRTQKLCAYFKNGKRFNIKNNIHRPAPWNRNHHHGTRSCTGLFSCGQFFV